MAGLASLRISIRDSAGNVYESGRDFMPAHIQLTTILPGGDNTLTWEEQGNLLAGPLLQPAWLGLANSVTVFDEEGALWGGRVDEVAFTVEAGGAWQVSVRGWGASLSDQFYTSKNIRNSNTYTLIAGALTDLAPAIQATTILAGGFTISNAADVTLKGMTAVAYISYLKTFGTAGNGPLTFYVYLDGDGTIRFTLLERPTTPSVGASLRPSFSRYAFKVSLRTYASSVSVFYAGGSQTATAAASYGLTRAYATYMTEIQAAGDAGQAAQTIVNYLSAPRLSATGSYVAKGSAPFLDLNSGAGVSPRRLRAGTMVRLLDVADTTAIVSSSPLNSFVVSATKWDEDAQTLEVTPESLEATFQRTVAQVRGTLMGRFGL